MNDSDIQATIDHIDELWPKSDLTPAVKEAISDRLRHIPVNSEQAKAALSEYRVRHRFKTPDVAAMLDRLRTAAHQEGTARDVLNMPTWELRRIQMKLGPEYDDEATVAVWFQRIGKREADTVGYGHSVAVANMICRYVAALVGELNWTVTDARAMAARRWGYVKEADEHMDRVYAKRGAA